jgi:hypothetical protein
VNYSEWEEYNGLPSDQEEDFYLIFCKYINQKGLDYNTAYNHFQPGTDTLVEFLEILENSTDWFNYTQMDEIFQELTLYLIQMSEEELGNDESELE